MTRIAAYVHESEPAEQQPDPRPGSYYVSALYYRKHSLLLGPFERHADALAAVELARAKANELDVRAPWYAYGTCRLDVEFREPGVLNGMLPGVVGLAVQS